MNKFESNSNITRTFNISAHLFLLPFLFFFFFKYLPYLESCLGVLDYIHFPHPDIAYQIKKKNWIAENEMQKNALELLKISYNTFQIDFMSVCTFRVVLIFFILFPKHKTLIIPEFGEILIHSGNCIFKS